VKVTHEKTTENTSNTCMNENKQKQHLQGKNKEKTTVEKLTWKMGHF